MQKQFNILLTTMRLDIGGAETHIVELAKGLKQMHYNVFVASKGGVYEKELEAYGIKHYYVPLDNKKPHNVVHAYKQLKQIIIDERIDLVHAHARIPGFICGLLHKKMHFPFVTTAHGTWKTGWGLKYITNWGQKTVAVSEDVKKYLLKNYKIDEADIKVTINGIDTEKFSPDIDTAALKKELGLSEGCNKIVYISRFDMDRKEIISQLFDIIPELAARIKNLKVIMVGGGNMLDKAIAQAKEINEKLNEEIVMVIGPRTDINRFTALADLFIGFGRSSLEGMASEKPLLLAGNKGYIGLLNEDVLDKAIKSNFSGRGEKMADNAQFINDISKFFLDMTPEQRQQLGRFSRKVVEEKYSINRMVKENIEVYTQLLTSDYQPSTIGHASKKEYDVIISGYYGFKNSGDDAILKSIIDNLMKLKPDIRIMVFSKNPEETKKHYGVDAINRFNLYSIFTAMRKAYLYINGGGNLIQNVTSTRSLTYYLCMIWLAKKMKLKVMLYANGIGPISGSFSRRLTSNILNRVEIITLREEASKEELDILNVTMPRILITADPALNLKPASEAEVADILAKEGLNDPLDKTKKLAGFSVRHWKGSEHFNSVIAQAADYMAEKYDVLPVFIPMHYPQDVAATEKIAALVKHKTLIIKNEHPVPQTLGIINRMEVLLGMRLHALIYASSLGIPIIGFNYDPKVEGFLSYVNQASAGPVESLEIESLKKLIDNVWHERRVLRSQLQSRSNVLKEKAFLNGDIAVDLLTQAISDAKDK